MKKLIFIVISIFLLCGCEKNVTVESYKMFYMDTYIEVKLYDIDKNESDLIFKEIDNIYNKYHKLSDRYKSYDNFINIYYLNNTLKIDEEIEICNELKDLIDYGIKMYNKTNEYVDIALGNVIDVWKKYREEGTSIPGLFELKTSGGTDINDIILNGNKFKRLSDVKIDLGGYAKGYVTELVGNYLEKEGYNKYLINAGGNVKVGTRYKDTKYLVGLEEPFNETNIYKKINVENTSVVTSGSYQRYYEYNDKNYNHIINPFTLFPENYTKSVTVITKDSGYADILSTYLFLLPIEDGIALVNKLDDVEAIWYSDKIYKSEGFSKYE